MAQQCALPHSFSESGVIAEVHSHKAEMTVAFGLKPGLRNGDSHLLRSPFPTEAGPLNCTADVSEPYSDEDNIHTGR